MAVWIDGAVRVALVVAVAGAFACAVAEAADVKRFHVVELTFAGPELGPRDTPARDVELAVTFRHESGKETVRVLGFWDGDGRGGARGGVFKVRFCPTRVGRWTIAETKSNRRELASRREGESIECTPSKHPGFWLADGRWYRRSDGSHPFIVGNTHYTFLSRRSDRGPSGVDPVADICANARYFKKLRFSLFGGRYPDPKCKPFLDDRGRQSDDGRYSLRPNPAWFHRRVDPVVREGSERDLICDLILAGPDTRGSRAALKGDPKAWLKYLAARYGAYPNVWFCLCNEWDIKNPRYSAAEIKAAGRTLRKYLAYPCGVSVHGSPRGWKPTLNGEWHDHVIIQYKVRRLADAADAAASNFRRGGRKPVCNDENAYQGRGDGFTHGQTIEGCFGTFLGGGYPTTGEKPAGKKGQYFWGGFDVRAHTAAVNLGYLRDYVDGHVSFWRLAPMPLKGSIFSGADEQFRLLALSGQEYVLGSNRKVAGLAAKLPRGTWRVAQVDLMARTTKPLAEAASGKYTFDTPNSRAALTHFRLAKR